MEFKKLRYKTWIEIDKSAFAHNIRVIKKLLRPQTKLWSVVKSNAYGHGLVAIATLGQKYGVDGFCVDSVVEGRRLREAGINKPILVLGPTLPILYPAAVDGELTLTVSTGEFLRSLDSTKIRPNFHLKIDTGMRRQGFYPEELPQIWRLIQKYKLDKNLTGVYTHFASAKDINYPAYTEQQFGQFLKATNFLGKVKGTAGLLKHCAASGGVLMNARYHLDAVRVGICLYGLWPSKELETQLGQSLKLKPVLSWKSIVSEIKPAKKGDYVGYDLTERLPRDSKLAIVPIGYWHGYDRGLSGIGEVLIRGRRARVLGRVSMDLLVVNITNVSCRVGDEVVLIGKSGKEEISACDLARQRDTTYYEVLTRINPLIRKIII